MNHLYQISFFMSSLYKNIVCFDLRTLNYTSLLQFLYLSSSDPGPDILILWLKD